MPFAQREATPMNIESALRQHESALRRLPNVTGLGIGERGGKEVIVVFVAEKLPAGGLPPQAIIPRTIEGYETDVRVELRIGQLESDQQAE